MSRYHRVFVVAAALLLPGIALASTVNPYGASAWTLYAFANGNVLFNLMQSASALVKSTAYMQLVGFVSLIAMVAVGIAATHGHNGAKQVLIMFLAIIGLTSVAMKDTSTVDITDPVTGYNNAISGVPVLVSIPEAVISTIGHDLTHLFETYYSLPNDLTLSGGSGFNLANALVNASTQVQVTDPLARATLAAYTQNCIVPELASGRLSAYSLVTSVQLWGTGGTLSPLFSGLLTPVYTSTQPEGITLPCGASGIPATGEPPAKDNTNGIPTVEDDAYDYLSAYFTNQSGGFFAQSAGAWSGTSAFSWLSATTSSAQSYLFGSSMTQTSGESIEQAAAVNALRPALNAAAVASGASQITTATAVAQGEASQQSNWATAATMFQDMSGYLYSALQAFLIALFPLILVTAFIPGAGRKVLGNAAKIMIWLALWEPTLSLINCIVDLYSQGQMGSALGATGGYSMANIGMVSQMTSHLTIAAGFLAAAVPLITWGFVSGGFAFTEFLAHGMGGAMAAQSGAEAATGNISLDNQSYDNRSIDQEMLAYQTSVGTGEAMVKNAGNGTITNEYVGGKNENIAGHDVANNLKADASRTASTLDSLSHNATSSAMTTASSAATEAYNKLLSWGNSHASQLHANSSQAETYNSTLQHLKELSQQGATKTDTADSASTGVDINTNGGANISGGKGASGSVGVGLRGDSNHKRSGSRGTSTSTQYGNKEQVSAQQASNYTLAVQKAVTAAENLTTNDGRSDTRQWQDVKAQSQQAVTTAQQAEQYQEQAGEARSLSVNPGFQTKAEADAAAATLKQIERDLPSPDPQGIDLSKRRVLGGVRAEQQTVKTATQDVHNVATAAETKTGAAKTRVHDAQTELGRHSNFGKDVDARLSADQKAVSGLANYYGQEAARLGVKVDAGFKKKADAALDGYLKSVGAANFNANNAMEVAMDGLKGMPYGGGGEGLRNEQLLVASAGVLASWAKKHPVIAASVAAMVTPNPAMGAETAKLDRVTNNMRDADDISQKIGKGESIHQALGKSNISVSELIDGMGPMAGKGAYGPRVQALYDAAKQYQADHPEHAGAVLATNSVALHDINQALAKAPAAPGGGG